MDPGWAAIVAALIGAAAAIFVGWLNYRPIHRDVVRPGKHYKDNHPRIPNGDPGILDQAPKQRNKLSRVRVLSAVICGVVAMFVAVLFLLSNYAPDRQSPPRALHVWAMKSPFHVGDPLDMRIVVGRPSYLFCFLLDHDREEATLLYPTYETQREHENWFGPSYGQMKFPEGFKSLKDTITIEFDKPTIEFFHCIATEQPLPDRLQGQWLKNTAAQYADKDPHGSRSLTPDKTREILSGLRESEGYSEDSARFEFVANSRFFTAYYLIPMGIIFIAMVLFMRWRLLGFARNWLNR
jgi:hypothetical protein